MYQRSSFFSGIFVGIVILLLLVSGIGATVYMLRGNITFFSRASSLGATSPISFDNSYVFASPITAPSDGRQKIRITVFVLSPQGLGVSGKNVSLKLDKFLMLDTINGVTDDTGKSLFDISSTVAGDYKVEAWVDNSPISQTLKISFR